MDTRKELVADVVACENKVDRYIKEKTDKVAQGKMTAYEYTNDLIELMKEEREARAVLRGYDLHNDQKRHRLSS